MTPQKTFLPRAIAALAIAAPFALSPWAHANFTPTTGGSHDYNLTSNWSGDTINNTFTAEPIANQTITFGADTTLSSTLAITSVGTINRTFIGSGGDRTLTLGGSVALLGNNSESNSVVFGSTTSGQKLNINLGSVTRKFEAYPNRTLEFLNVISGSGNISREGGGTVKLTNTANTFTGSVSFTNTGGVLEVTKLAHGGADSSIGKSDNSTSKISFGGTSAGTLRYVGTGDSTDRRFSVGGVGAIFDASGTGALIWTNTGNFGNNNTGATRTITFTGTNTDNNTMSVAISDNGVGKISLAKEGTGTWVLAGDNGTTGDIIVTQGKLALGASERLGNTARLVLNGGTFATGGFNETLGAVAVTANSIIDLGDGASALIFADSSAQAWGGSFSLSFINYTEGMDSIKFGANQDGLTINQLGQITINGFAANIDESGYLSLVAIPEPSSYALLAGAVCLLAVGSRRSRQRSSV